MALSSFCKLFSAHGKSGRFCALFERGKCLSLTPASACALPHPDCQPVLHVEGFPQVLGVWKEVRLGDTDIQGEAAALAQPRLK